VIEEELAQIKESLIQGLMLLPQDALVGLISFGKNVRFTFVVLSLSVTISLSLSLSLSLSIAHECS
jgi:hypothetical protein